MQIDMQKYVYLFELCDKYTAGVFANEGKKKNKKGI